MDRLISLVREHPRLFVLTGAGCSTDSGIPAYRDERGTWLGSQPIDHKAFMTDSHARCRYWARSLVGWTHFQAAEPNECHHKLTDLQRAGFMERLVTQNVDGLHTRAGTRSVIDLHGRNDRVRCAACQRVYARARFQAELTRRNPHIAAFEAQPAPDGDAHLPPMDLSRFVIPSCPACAGVLRPDVVFFGAAVPRLRVSLAYQALDKADALLAIGTSLTVYSGFRFCRAANERNIPILLVNRGATRADDMATHKVALGCAVVTRTLVGELVPEDGRCRPEHTSETAN
jgi:NAD-dependent SIR2 family protein deacetylase